MNYKIDILAKNNLVEYLIHVYENNNMDVPEQLKEKNIKLSQDREKIVGELSEVLETLGEFDENTNLQLTMQTKQMVNGKYLFNLTVK